MRISGFRGLGLWGLESLGGLERVQGFGVRGFEEFGSVWVPSFRISGVQGLRVLRVQALGGGASFGGFRVQGFEDLSGAPGARGLDLTGSGILGF